MTNTNLTPMMRWFFAVAATLAASGIIGLFVVAEAIEGGVLFPLLLGKETGLHPVAIVVVLLAGGVLMGTLGVIIAIPLALICKVLWRELVLPLYKAWANPGEEREAAGASGGATS